MRSFGERSIHHGVTLPNISDVRPIGTGLMRSAEPRSSLGSPAERRRRGGSAQPAPHHIPKWSVRPQSRSQKERFRRLMAVTEAALQECKRLAVRRFSRIMNAGEILWHGFTKSAIQTRLWQKRGKVLIHIKRLWPLA